MASVWDRLAYKATCCDGVVAVELTGPIAETDPAMVAMQLIAGGSKAAVAEGYDKEGRTVRLGKYDKIMGVFPGAVADLRRVVVSLYEVLPGKLKKEDYWIVARNRKVAATGAALWGMKVDALVELIGELTQSDEVALARQIHRRKAFEAKNPGVAIPALKAQLKALGIVPGGAVRGGLIDLLLAAEDGSVRPTIVALDEYQQEVVNMAVHGSLPRLLINAGPGAGKTTTLTHMIQQFCVHHPEYRVLVLAFNVNAEATLKSRLRAMGVQSMITKGETYSAPNGVAVLTFDKFAYQAQKAAPDRLLQMMSGLVVGDVSYNRAKEEAASLIEKHASLRNWNVVIVDEGQDVSDEAAIVRALTLNTRLIVAGDPRQEVYSGATWYSHLWASSPPECKRVLYYNYRSAPAIVAALNAYSKNAFPQLHHDQIAVREADEAPALRVEECTGAGEVATEAAATMATCDPGTAYLVAPVTVEKMGMETVTQIVRQELHERRVGSYTIVLSGDTKANVQESVYYIATAKKIKGTEKPTVVVCGIDTDSYDRVVEHAALAKLIFVALSRAQDRLVLLSRPLVNAQGTKRLRIVDLIAPFIEAAGGIVPNVPSPKMSLLWRVIPVTGSGITGENGFSLVQTDFPVTYTELASGPRINLERDAYNTDADFIGRMAETLVLEAAGAPTLQANECEIVGVHDSGRCGIEHNGTSHILTVLTKNKNTLTKALSLPHSNNAYYQTVIGYTLECGKLWTISERHMHTTSAEAEAVVAHLATLIGDMSEVRAQKRYSCLLCDTRGANAFGDNKYQPVVTGIADAYFPHARLRSEDECESGDPPGLILELKHVKELTNKHRRQASVYALFQGCPGALLYNTADGAAEYVEAADYYSVTHAGRATLAVALARQTILTVLRKDSITPSAVALQSTVFVALDVETTRTETGTLITELGAVAVSATGWDVLGTFYSLNKGARLMTPDEKPRYRPELRNVDMGEKVARIRVHDPERLALDDGVIRMSFHAWLDEMSGSRTFIHWAGSERDIITHPLTGVIAGPCIDAHHGAYLPWLDLRGDKRTSSTTLTDAVKHLLPKLPFVPHQALEDAIATMAVFLATTGFHGVC